MEVSSKELEKKLEKGSLYFDVLGEGVSCIALDTFHSAFEFKSGKAVTNTHFIVFYKYKTNPNVVMRVTIDNEEVAALLAPAAYFKEEANEH